MRRLATLTTLLALGIAPGAGAVGHHLTMTQARTAIAAYIAPDGAASYTIDECRRYGPLSITCHVAEQYVPTEANENLVGSEESVSVYLHGRKLGVRGSLKELGFP